MAIEHTYQPLYVTELNEATLLSSTDWLFLSQKLSSDSSYLSKKVSIQTVIDSFFESIDAASKSSLDNLSILVLKNIADIKDDNKLISNIISCLIKMANCILTNKINIAAISTYNEIIDNSPISSNSTVSYKAPSLKSVYDYCENTFLKEADYDDPSSIIDNELIDIEKNVTNKATSPKAVFEYCKNFIRSITIEDSLDLVSNEGVALGHDITNKAPSFNSVYDYCENTFLKLTDYSDPSSIIDNEPIETEKDVSAKAASPKAVYDYCENTFLKEVKYSDLTSIIDNESIVTEKNVINKAASPKAVYDYGLTISATLKTYSDNKINNSTISSNYNITNAAPTFNAVYNYVNSSINNNKYILSTATSSIIGGIKIWTGTSANYNAIASKNTDTLYFIHD